MHAGWRTLTCISIRQDGETTLLHAPVFMTEHRPNHLPLLMGQPALPGLSIYYITLDIYYYISMDAGGVVSCQITFSADWSGRIFVQPTGGQ
jgi:hypothetical protein